MSRCTSVNQAALAAVLAAVAAAFLLCSACPARALAEGAAPQELAVGAGASSVSFTNSERNFDVDTSNAIYLAGGSADAVKWESTNPSAVEITSSTTRKAVVKCVGRGSSDIVATGADGSSATCRVNVSLPEFAIEDQLEIGVDDTTRVYAGPSHAVRWKSSNDDIVSIVSTDSTYAVVKGEGVGTAIVTATDAYGTEAECRVAVRREILELALVPNFDLSERCDEINFSRYYHECYRQGWWDDDYNYHDSQHYYSSLTYYYIEATRGSIAGCTSDNASIVSVENNGGIQWVVRPVGVGTTNLRFSNPYGEEKAIRCHVTLDYFTESEIYYSNGDYYRRKKGDYSCQNMVYGDGAIRGITYNDANVTVSVDGVEYHGTADSSGNFSIQVPRLVRIGTPIRVVASRYNITQAFDVAVVGNNPKLYVDSAKRSAKKVKVTIKGVYEGDYVKLKAGKKTYTKRIASDKQIVSLKFKTKKLKKGWKVKATLYNRFGQVLASKSRKVK